MPFSIFLLPAVDDHIEGPWGGYPPGLAYDQVNDTPGAWDNGATSLKHTPTGASNDVARFFPTLLPVVASIQYVRPWWRGNRKSGGDTRAKGHIHFAGTGNTYEDAGYQGLVESMALYGGDTYPTNPDTGDPWLREDLMPDAISFGATYQSPAVLKTALLDAVALEVSVVATPIPLEQVRDVLSRHQWDWRQPKGLLELLVPLHEGMEPDLLDAVEVAHFAGPHPTDPGWLDEARKRRRMIVYSREPLPGTGLVRLKLRDGRPHLRLFRDDAWCKRTAAAEGDSIGRFSTGCSRTFARDSPAWVEDPSSRLWVQVGNDVERHGFGGDYHEGGGKNKILNSGFQTGNFSAWSKTGTGVNGSSIEADPEAAEFYDPDTTGVTQGCTLTAGSPHAADQYLAQNSEAFGPLATARVQLAYKNLTESGLLYYFLKRTSDGFYYLDVDRSWHAGPSITWNPLPPSFDAVAEFRTQRIDLNGAVNALQAGIGQPLGLTLDGQVDRAYAVQVENGAQASSWMLSDAVDYAIRQPEVLFISNNSTARCHLAAQGTAIVEWIPFCEQNAVPGTQKTLLALDYDLGVGNNRMWLRYHVDDRRVKFEQRINGTQYITTVLMPMYLGAVHRIVARWTGPAGELGLAPYTMTVFAQGIAGTSVVAEMPTVPDENNLEIGGEQTGNQPADGIVRLVDIRQYPMSNEECVAVALVDEE